MSETIERTLPIAPRFVARDETEYWDLSTCPYREYVERIEAVYFFDANVVTCCCEFTPSYWLQHIENRAVLTGAAYALPDDEQDNVFEAIDDWVRSGIIDDGSMYVHCHVVDSWPGIVAEPDSDIPYEDVSEEEQVEVYIDHFRGNPCL